MPISWSTLLSLLGLALIFDVFIYVLPYSLCRNLQITKPCDAKIWMLVCWGQKMTCLMYLETL